MNLIKSCLPSSLGTELTEVVQAGKKALKKVTKEVTKVLKSDVTAKVSTFVKNNVLSPLPLFFGTASDSMKELFSIAEREVSSLKQRINRDDVEPLVMATLALQNAPTLEAYFEVLAQNASYCHFENGTNLPVSPHFADPGFKVEKTLQFPGGVRALVIVSEQQDVAPLLVFRGTNPSNVHNVADDFNRAIGELNCKRYARELKKELEQLSTRYGQVHIMGHSYGGAIAEHLTSEHPQLIQRCTSYNAPGCGQKAIDRFTRRSAKLPRGYVKPQVVSYRHAKDIASLLGSGHLPTDPGRNFTYGSENDGISYIEAHSFNALSVQGLQVRINQQPSRGFTSFASAIEKARKYLSRGIPLYKFIAG